MRRTLWIATLVSSMLVACPLLDAGNDKADATTADTIGTDTIGTDTIAGTDNGGGGPCTKNRDCFTRGDYTPVCDTATGECIHPAWVLMMPCDTENDCRTYYNTSLVYCSKAKLCSAPCPMQAGESPATSCGYSGERTCGFDEICTCTSEQYCGAGEICGVVAKRCLPKCTSNRDCAPIEGTTCDLATGQCV